MSYNCLSIVGTWVHPAFLVRSILFIFLEFCVCFVSLHSVCCFQCCPCASSLLVLDSRFNPKFSVGWFICYLCSLFYWCSGVLHYTICLHFVYEYHDGCFIRGRNCLSLASINGFILGFLFGSVLLIRLVFCVVFVFVLCLVCDSVPHIASASGFSIVNCPFCFL